VLLWPVGIVTLPGTATTAVLLLTAMDVALAVDLFNETVHVLDAPPATAVGAQATLVNWTGATKFSANDCELPLTPAAMIAVWLLAIGPTVTGKLPMVDPEATVTLAGTGALELLLDRAIASPPLGAAVLSVAVQTEEPGAFTLDGLHVKVLRVTGVGGTTVMVPLVPDEGMEFPPGSDVTIPLRVMGTLVLLLVPEIVKLAVATAAVAIGFASRL